MHRHMFVPSGSSLHAHIHTHSVVCVRGFCVSIWRLDHTWVSAYLHSICICFARGGKQRLLMQDLSQFKRTKQIVPVPEAILLIPPLTAKYCSYCIPSLVVRTV